MKIRLQIVEIKAKIAHDVQERTTTSRMRTSPFSDLMYLIIGRLILIFLHIYITAYPKCHIHFDPGEKIRSKLKLHKTVS